MLDSIQKSFFTVLMTDDNSNDYDMDADMEAKWAESGMFGKTTWSGDNMWNSLISESILFTSDAHLILKDTSDSDQFHVVTVSDTGRNWSDREVRALIRVWSDERVCKQLESSTRKRDIFVQISNRLMQQGIERDWKQCHTKYKNLKYLYRSLQRGRTEETDPRRLMRFYDEVDAIMTRTTQGSPNDREDNQADSERLLMMEDVEENDHIHSSKMDNVTTTAGPVERSSSSCSLSSGSLNGGQNSEEPREHTEQEPQHRLMGDHIIIIHSGVKIHFSKSTEKL